MSLHGPPPPSGSGTTVSVLVTDDQMRGFDSTRASPHGDASCSKPLEGGLQLFGAGTPSGVCGIHSAALASASVPIPPFPGYQQSAQPHDRKGLPAFGPGSPLRKADVLILGIGEATRLAGSLRGNCRAS